MLTIFKMLTIFFNLCSKFFNLVEDITEPSRFFFSHTVPHSLSLSGRAPPPSGDTPRTAGRTSMAAMNAGQRAGSARAGRLLRKKKDPEN